MICASNHDNGGRIRMRGFVVLLADEHSGDHGQRAAVSFALKNSKEALVPDLRLGPVVARF